MTTRQQAGQDAADDLGLADDDLTHLRLDGAGGLDEAKRCWTRLRLGLASRRNVGGQNGHFWSRELK